MEIIIIIIIIYTYKYCTYIQSRVKTSPNVAWHVMNVALVNKP